MTTFTPTGLPAAVAATLPIVAGLMLLASPGHAAAPGAEPVIATLRGVDDSALPAIARSGSGASVVLDARAFDAGVLSIRLPDGRTLQASRQQTTEDTARGSKSWVGTFTEQPGSIVAFSTVRGVSTGSISYGAETWEILPARSGEHLLYRVDESKLPTAELELPQAPAVDKDLATADGDDGLGVTTATAGGAVVDLLVVYTPAVRVAYSQAALASMLQNAVAMANQAYLNSRVAVTLNLVGLQEIAYTETGIQSSIDALRSTSDGKMDSVHALRNSVGADVVTLVTQDSDACGIASVMTTVSSSFASQAFSVVKAGCLSQHSLAHEIGHNMGNRHDRASTSGSGAYPYSYGFRRCTTDGTGFRTVMSYSCTGASRVAWFSNPNVFYNGYATGIAYEANPTNSADNARSMNNAAATVAAFRTSGSPTAPGTTVPAAPAALSALAASASTINLRWTDSSSSETGFIVQRSVNGVDYTQIATLSAGTTSYASNGLAASTLYYYRVRAYNSAGNSSFSNTASTRTTAAILAPAKPTYVAAVNRADGSAKVSWTDASGNETRFEVRRSTWNRVKLIWDSTRIVGTVSQNVTSYVDYAGKGQYRYSVRAVNSGGASSYAGPVVVTVTTG